MDISIHEFRDVGSHDDLPMELIPGLEACISSAFGGNITAEDARNHMLGEQVLIAFTGEGDSRIVQGFSSVLSISPAEKFEDRSLEDKVGVYFAGAAVCEAAQSHGVYHRLNMHRLSFALKKDIDFIFTQTQNPRVFEAITKSVEHLVKEGHIGAYGIRRILRPGAYGRMLTADVPVGRHGVRFDLDYENGDAEIITWQFQK